MTLDTLLEKMWKDYCRLNPAAKRIHDLLRQRGETVLNDHIALRTFEHPRLGIHVLAKQFGSLGYRANGEYIFEEKKLFAKHWEHSDETKPKIFISELQLRHFSPFLQKTVTQIIESLTESQISAPDFTVAGRLWPMEYQTYLKLAEESEYASWVAAIGFRPNHFTVNVSQLKSFPNLQSLNAFLKDNGYKLNSAGGEIKGTADVYLEQSSTMAEQIEIEFTDGIYKVPGCYYEFARRYPLSNGKPYQGFVAKSADKIFESTNRSS